MMLPTTNLIGPNNYYLYFIINGTFLQKLLYNANTHQSQSLIKLQNQNAEELFNEFVTQKKQSDPMPYSNS